MATVYIVLGNKLLDITKSDLTRNYQTRLMDKYRNVVDIGAGMSFRVFAEEDKEYVYHWIKP